MASSYPIQKIRQSIPALERQHQGKPVIYLNGPGGTQIPRVVVDAVSDYLLNWNANLGGPFITSEKTTEILQNTREAMACYINANWDEISFGGNMTSLTFAFSRSLANQWQAGDNIIVTELEHESNVSPWIRAAEERGVEIRVWPVDSETVTLDVNRLDDLLDEKTKLVAVTMASNLVGSHVDVKAAAIKTHAAGADIFVDATHAAAHLSIDVQDIDCDYLVCSAYKFSAPHVGILFGKKAKMETLQPYKVMPVADVQPSRWETGTQNFEGLAGLLALLQYKSHLAGDAQMSVQAFKNTMGMIRNYETELNQHFIAGLRELKHVQLYGLQSDDSMNQRTPTFAIRIDGEAPMDSAKRLAEAGMFAGAGHFYVTGVTKRLNLHPEGILRLGFAYYNSLEEVERLLDTL